MDKIAIIIEDQRLGGPQKQLIYLIQQLIRNKKIQNYFLIVPLGFKKLLSEFVNIKKINIFEVKIEYLSKIKLFFFIFYFFRDFYTLKNALSKFEKIYIAGGTSNIKTLIISAILKKKIFLHVHDTRLNFFGKIIIFILSNFVNKTFFASEKSKIYYDKIIHCKKKYILKSSVNINYFKQRKKMSNTHLNVGMIANINSDKNIELFLKILSKCKNSKTKFFLIGKVWESQKKYFDKKLNNLVGFKSKLKWYKNINNPIKIMKKFDVLICTSRFESLPLAIVESLSLSIPIISTDVGDIKKFIDNKKNKCGFIISDFDENKFLKKIYLLIKDKKKLINYGKNARKIAEENFSILRYAKQFEKYTLN